MIMNILLKDILRESGGSKRHVQMYIDMDGVLADMDARFEELSGGYHPNNLKNKFGGDERRARKEFWKIIATDPNFWLSLKVLPDAKQLWDFVKANFKDPVPVILTAGQGASVVSQKTAWAHKYIDPTAKVIVASGGAKKPEYIIEYPGDAEALHILVDDTPRNIDAWNISGETHIAILHKNSQQSIQALKKYMV